MTNKAMNTLKAIVESGMVPNEQGTPVAPPEYISKAYNCADEYSDNSAYNNARKSLADNAVGKSVEVVPQYMSWTHGQTSKQYTPSGEFDRKVEPFYLGFRFWLLCAVVFGLSVLAGKFAMQWALGAL